jgi:hypothetical protein
MEACRETLPALIRRHQEPASALPVVMGKCHLMIRPKPSMLLPDAGVLAGSLR